MAYAAEETSGGTEAQKGQEPGREISELIETRNDAEVSLGIHDEPAVFVGEVTDGESK